MSITFLIRVILRASLFAALWLLWREQGLSGQIIMALLLVIVNAIVWWETLTNTPRIIKIRIRRVNGKSLGYRYHRREA